MRQKSSTVWSSRAGFVSALLLTVVMPPFTVDAGTSSMSRDPLSISRQRVQNIAAPEYRQWVQEQPEKELKRFGFPSRADAASAQLLTAIPVVTPRQDRGRFTATDIERDMDREPISWTIPVSVGGRIVALVRVDTPPGAQPEVVSYGQPYAANRIAAGLRALGSPRFDQWSNVRYVTFSGPWLELLAVRTPDGRWTWVELSGTESASAAPIAGRELQNKLEAMVVSERGDQ